MILLLIFVVRIFTYFLINHMIQVTEALSIIAENSSKMPVKKIKVSKSLGFIVAKTIYSPMNMPPFRQSAMDGYAFFAQ